MTKFELGFGVGLLGLAVLMQGCCSDCRGTAGASPREAVATRVSGSIVLDGKLDEPDWTKARAYELMPGGETYDKLPEAMKATVGRDLREKGECRLLWDKDNLYVAASFVDSDLYAYGKEDHQHHYAMGDVFEVFIKPVDESYYWELYVTPLGHKTAFFFPGRGARIGVAMALEPIDIKVAAHVDGSVNNWHDRDRVWTAEMAIPRKELEKYGAKFGPGTKWLIFLARYNYSRYLPVTELSSYPAQAQVPNFHIHEEYASLKLAE